MSLITNIEPQEEAAQMLLTHLLRKRIPILGVRSKVYPVQFLVVFIGETQSSHAQIPSNWYGYPVRVEGFGVLGPIN